MLFNAQITFVLDGDIVGVVNGKRLLVSAHVWNVEVELRGEHKYWWLKHRAGTSNSTSGHDDYSIAGVGDVTESRA